MVRTTGPKCTASGLCNFPPGMPYDETTMTTTRLPVIALVLCALTLLCLLIDVPLARSLDDAGLKAFVNPVITVIEYAFGFPISKWLTGFVLLLVAIVLFFAARWRPAAWLLLFVALSQLATRLIAGVLKNVFERTRPYQGPDDRWFVDGGSSFPSGHAAHFWGLFFALAIAFPRTRVPALILAVFVSLSRVAVNDHYLSDVAGSAAIAALVTWGFALGFRRRLTPLAIP